MTRICAWCETVMSIAIGSKQEPSHTLCSDCLGALKVQMNQQGLRLTETRAEP